MAMIFGTIEHHQWTVISDLLRALRSHFSHYVFQTRAAEKQLKNWLVHNLSICTWCWLWLYFQCHEALITRQKLIAQDYKVSYSLARACKSDVRKYRCSADSLPRAREARLSYLLLCLESAVHRGKRLPHTQAAHESLNHHRTLIYVLWRGMFRTFWTINGICM